MNGRKWESLCKRCGLCCYEKDRTPDGRFIIRLDKPCFWLDQEKRTCTVYTERFRTYENCKKMTIFHALFAGYLPSTCGYVEHFRPFRLRKQPVYYPFVSPVFTGTEFQRSEPTETSVQFPCMEEK